MPGGSLRGVVVDPEPAWLAARDAASFHPYTYTPVTLPPDAQIAAIRLTTAPSGAGMRCS